MGNKTPPCEVYPAWTTARFWTFIRSALRQAHVKWPPAQEAMKTGRRAVTGKRHKWEHQCEACQQWVPQPQIEKDHRVAVGTLRAYEDLPGFVTRLFVPVSGYRKLCKPCHQQITNTARTKRDKT